MSFFPRKPVFTVNQIERLSNILDNAGQVFLGVLVLSPLVQGIDKTNFWVLALGVFDVIFFGGVSMRLAKGKEVLKDDI